MAPRCFFQRRVQPRKATAQSPPSQLDAAAFILRTYRRTLPAASLGESLRLLTWPHSPSAGTPQSRADYLSSLPESEQSAFSARSSQRLSSACSSVLSLLSLLSLIPLRPYDLSLHTIAPSEPPFLPLLSSDTVHDSLLSPLLYSLGFRRQRLSFVLAAPAARLTAHLEAVHDEVSRLRDEAGDGGPGEEEGDEVGIGGTGAFQVMEIGDAIRPGNGANGDSDLEDCDAADEEAEYAGSAATEETMASLAARRRSTIHTTTHRVRPMPSQPTRARHGRATFKEPSLSAMPAIPLSPSHSTAAQPPSSTTPKPLLPNVMGDRRTAPVLLPTAFLAAAPVYPTGPSASATSADPRFLLQPAHLDLGPLLLGRRYTVTLLLTNLSPSYARFHIPLIPSSPALSLIPLHRPGGLSPGLSKRIRLSITARAPGVAQGVVEVVSEGEACRMGVEGEVVEGEDEWRGRRERWEGVAAGAMGMVRGGGRLPGSVKEVRGEVGRVREVVEGEGREEEESKEQLLYSAMMATRHRGRDA